MRIPASIKKKKQEIKIPVFFSSYKYVPRNREFVPYKSFSYSYQSTVKLPECSQASVSGLYDPLRYRYFRSILKIKNQEKQQDAISATDTAPQIPSMPKIRGSSNTAASSKTIDLINEITADILPSFNEVKKEEANILPPASK